MNDMSANFILGDDGIAYLYRDGQIVASSPNLDELEKLAQDSTFGQQGLTPSFMPQSPTTQTNMPCMNCGQPGCPGCAGPTGGTMPMNTPAVPTAPMGGVTASDKEERQEEEDDELKTDDPMGALKKATHIVTPNGIRGKIVGHAKGLWGDEVTVRLENGRIAKYDVASANYTLENDSPKVSAYRSLQAKLDEVPEGNLASLYKRLQTLSDIKRQASRLVSSAKHLDLQELDNMIVMADYEVNEVRNAIDALEQEEHFAPEYNTAPQISMNGGDASWLDDVLQEIHDENQDTDYDQMMAEAPETLIAEIETPMLADQEAVANTANDFVTSKTVGMNPKIVSEFRKAFLARVDEVRNREITARHQQYKAARKTASKPPIDEGPDEGLFS